MRKVITALLVLCGSVVAQTSQNQKSQTITGSGCLVINTSNRATVGIQVGNFGSAWSGTIQPNVQTVVNGIGQGFTAVQVTPTNSTTAQSTITANGTYWAIVAGFDQFEVCGNTVTNAANVTLNATTMLAVNILGGGGGSVSATQYYPQAGNASSKIASYPWELVTNSDSGSDVCAREADVAAVTVGGNQFNTIEARGEEGSETAAAYTCASGTNPLPSTSTYGGSSTLNGSNYLEPPGLASLISGWQIGQNQVHMYGTGWGSNIGGATKNRSTILQASNSFSISGSGATYAPQLFGIGATYGTAANGLGPYGSGAHFFVSDANSQPGVVPFVFGSGQEGTEADHFTAQNGCGTLLDMGLGSNSIADGGRLDSFNLSYTASSTCPLANSTPATITAWSVVNPSGSTYIAVVTYSTGSAPTITPTPGMQVIVTGSTSGSHYNINTDSVVGTNICAVGASAGSNSGDWNDARCANISGLFSGTNQFAYLVNETQTDSQATSSGSGNFYGVMGRYNVTHAGTREWSNFTIDGANAANQPLIGLSASGLMNSTFRDGHFEECTACIVVGDNAATDGFYADEISATTSTTYGVYFSNAWGVVKDSWISKLTGFGTGSDTTAVLDDVPNGNLLTKTNNPFLNLYATDHAGYPFTFANPAAGVEVANGFDFYNGTFCIYASGTCKSKVDNTGTFTGAYAKLTGNASTGSPSFAMTGTPYTGGSGTTTVPFFYLDSSGSNPSTFSTAGTMFGENTPSGFTGNLMDFHINGGVSVAKLDYQGNWTGASFASTSASNAGLLALVGNTANPSIPSNSAGWLGPTSASFTAYALQLPSTAPTTSTSPFLSCATPSSNISTCSWVAGGTGLSGMTAGQVAIAATATTVTSSTALLGTDSSIMTGTGTFSATKIAIGDANGGITPATALPSGTTATTQSAGDNSTKVATTAYFDSVSGCQAQCYWYPWWGAPQGSINAAYPLGTVEQPGLWRFYQTGVNTATTIYWNLANGVSSTHIDMGVYGPCSATTCSLAWHTGSQSSASSGNASHAITPVTTAPGVYYLAVCSDSTSVTWSAPGLASTGSSMFSNAAAHTFGADATDTCTTGVLPSSITIANITNNAASNQVPFIIVGN